MKIPHPLTSLLNLLKYLLLVLVLATLTLAAGAGWLLTTEGGLNTTLELARSLTGERLQTQGARGRLLGPVEIDQIIWSTPENNIHIEAFKLDWIPESLFSRKIEITGLQINSLQIAHTSESETPPPEQLTIPLPFGLTLDIQSLKLGALVLMDPEQPDTLPPPLLSDLQAQLSSNGQIHHLKTLSLKRDQLQLEAQGQLDGISPFPLQATLNLKGKLEEHPLSLDLKANGPLTELPLTGELKGRNSQGNFEITLTPFATQAFSHLQAQLRGINPADWQEGAPQAKLDLDLNIHPLPEEILALSGQFEAHNRQPGRLDQGRIPLERLAGKVMWQGKTLELSSLDAQLPNNAHFMGKLGLNLEAPLQFSADGQLANLNPARLSDFPQANINGNFTIEGQVASTLSFNLEFRLRNSQILGKVFGGQGQLAWDGSRISTQGLQLNAGSNQLQARGALGAPGDSLQVNIRAPHLSDIGLATGDLNANLQLSGALTLPQISGTATSKNLSIPNLANLEALNLEARMGTRPNDPLQIKLTLKKLQQPGSGQGMSSTTLQVSGSRQQHQIQLDTQLSLPDISFLDKNQLLISAKGNLANNQNWSGVLEQLQLTPKLKDAPPLLSLEAPTPLRLGQSFHIGPAVLKGQDWQAKIEHVSFQQNQWRSAGSLEKFPLARFFPANNKSNLQISANWNLGLGNRPSGQISIWRADGDIMAGTNTLTALGLSLARLDIALDGEQPKLKLEAKGEKLGSISGQLQFSGHDPLHQPWQGQVSAKIPDISWLSPLLGEALQVGGNMEAKLAISGNPGRPLLKGYLRGEELHFRAMESGFRLESGKLALNFDKNSAGEHTLSLDQFAFSSPFSPLPRTLDNSQKETLGAIAATPGRITGKGKITISNNTEAARGELNFNLDRLGVVQKPHQWIALSGQGQLAFTESLLDFGAQLKVDGAYWELDDANTPRLSDDVVITREDTPPPTPSRFKPTMDIQINLGQAFHFAGVGVSSLLRGDLRVQGKGEGSPTARGTIRTYNGRFNAYGQRLSIEQGILTFNGMINNPGLNIRAMRKNQAVEAGVSITGTAQRPIIKLVSNPNVPDVEKLSWLILGEPPEQVGNAALLAAANAILGGQDQGPGSILREIQQTLGVDVSIAQSGSGPATTSQVASGSGFGNNPQTGSGQVVRVGTRLASDLTLSYEQSLAGTESIVKLTLALSRRISVIAQAGTDNAVNLFYTVRFGQAGGRRERDAATSSSQDGASSTPPP